MWAILAAAEALPSWKDLGVLGVIALALMVGAGLVYKYGVLPERKRAEDERARADAERGKLDALSERLLPLVAQLPATLTEFVTEARGLMGEIRLFVGQQRPPWGR